MGSSKEQKLKLNQKGNWGRNSKEAHPLQAIWLWQNSSFSWPHRAAEQWRFKANNIFIFFLWPCWDSIPIITTKASKGSCLGICVRSVTEKGQKTGKRPGPGKSPRFAILCFSSCLLLKKVIVSGKLRQLMVQLLSKCKAWFFKSPFWPAQKDSFFPQCAQQSQSIVFCNQQLHQSVWILGSVRNLRCSSLDTRLGKEKYLQALSLVIKLMEQSQRLSCLCLLYSLSPYHYSL